jgi:uncharacterized membrane protein
LDNKSLTVEVIRILSTASLEVIKRGREKMSCYNKIMTLSNLFLTLAIVAILYDYSYVPVEGFSLNTRRVTSNAAIIGSRKTYNVMMPATSSTLHRRNVIKGSTNDDSSSSSSSSSTSSLFATTTESSSSSSSSLTAGIGEEGCKLPSVSGINTKDELIQAIIVLGIFLSLGVGTTLFTSSLSLFSTTLNNNYPHPYEIFRYTWPIVFGLIYSLAGITHFTVAKEYENIYPSRGSWGIWYIPGSKQFHVAWTGIAEFVFGLGLLISGISSIVSSSSSSLLITPFTSTAGLESDCAAGLFLLTTLVTPANIYMYTHGAKLPMDSEPLPVTFHGVRWLMQVVLLGFLYQIGDETFQVLF